MYLKNLHEYELIELVHKMFGKIDVVTCDYHEDVDAWKISVIISRKFNLILRNTEQTDVLLLSVTGLSSYRLDITENHRSIWNAFLREKGVI